MLSRIRSVPPDEMTLRTPQPLKAPLIRSAAGIIVLLTLLTFFARRWWIADLIANLRMQLVIVLMITLAVCVVRRQWKVAVLLLSVAAIHVTWLSSAFLARPSTATTGVHLRVMTVNVHTRNSRRKRIADELRNTGADVVAVLELNTALARHLADALATEYPWRITEPMSDSNFGIGLYSRYPLIQPRVFRIHDERIPSLSAAVAVGDRLIQVIATHPLPPMGRESFDLRNQHLQQLAVRISESHSDFDATVLLGDLNLTPWSPHFDDFEAVSGLHSTALGFGLAPTWYRFDSDVFGLVLDHCLVSDSVQCVDRRIGEDLGSDHRSVTVDLLLAAPGR